MNNSVEKTETSKSLCDPFFLFERMAEAETLAELEYPRRYLSNVKGDEWEQVFSIFYDYKAASLISKMQDAQIPKESPCVIKVHTNYLWLRRFVKRIKVKFKSLCTTRVDF